MQQQRLERALRRDKQRQKRIRDSGIEYEYKPLEAVVAPRPSTSGSMSKQPKLECAAKGNGMSRGKVFILKQER